MVFTFWSCFHSINRRNWNSSITWPCSAVAEEPKSGKRKSNDVRNKIHTSHQIQADTTLNQVENKRKACSGGSGGEGWEGQTGVRVTGCQLTCRTRCSSAVAVVMCISFSQITSLQLGRASRHIRNGGVENPRLARWIASSHPRDCIWKHFEETLGVGNTNTHVT